MKPPPEKVIVKVVDEVVMTKGAPSYMVSFGDMMTLILCFFILLVSMSSERNNGLMAKGIGSFVVQLKSHGLTGILSGVEKEEIFEQVRRRFNLPPEPDPERRAKHSKASSSEMLRAESLELLEPHREVSTPRIASFQPGSSSLSETGRNFLNQLAPTLRPRRGQLLVLEGHALDVGHTNNPHQLALARALSVRDFLISEHDFPATRTEARVWIHEFLKDSANTQSVDARLVSPNR